MLDKDTPITYDNRVFSVEGLENTAPQPPVPVQFRPVSPPMAETESDAMETDDDPVGDAIRVGTNVDTDEEVVYPRSVRILSVKCFYDQLCALLKY